MRREKIKSEMQKGRQQQTPRKSRESSDHFENIYSNKLKILKKWTNF
jgi:hypothetical protein